MKTNSTKLEHKCYWNHWAIKKVEELTKEEVLEDDDIVQCYKCKEATSQCPSYIGKFYIK